ncbi:MAG: hypothetical protein IKE55_10140 [Kiritimatiellae bacterium]|nr:hypothetical protein [Kiritimatiellia bacterium]
MELPRKIGCGIWIALLWATVVLVCEAWLHRYSTNTSAGRFYRNDRWRGVTLVIEKDGSSREF